MQGALSEVLHDHGWALSGEPARLRAALSDVLGAGSDEHRGAVDAVVLAAEEGLPAELAERGSGEELRRELVEALVEWGLAETQAQRAIAAWAECAPPPPEVTAPPPEAVVETQLPPSVASDPAPRPDSATELPPTTMPPADQVETEAETEPATEAETSPQPEQTRLPPAPAAVVAATALPAAVEASDPTDERDLTELPPAPGPAVDRREMSSPPGVGPPAVDEAQALAADAANAGGPPSELVDEPPPADSAMVVDSTSERRSRRGLLIAGLVAAAVLVGGTLVAVAIGGGTDQEPAAGPSVSASPVADEATSPAVASPLAPGQVLTANVSPDPVDTEVAMASRTAGVRVSGVSELDSVTVGGEERAAPDGASLVAFTLAGFPCDATCIDWTKAGLRIAVDGSVTKLASPARGHVVVVPDEAKRVDLILKRDGRTQRLSLLDAAAGKGNLVVLGRRDRVAPVDERTNATESFSRTFTFPDGVEYSKVDRQVTVGDAALHFWVRDGGKWLDAGKPDQAFAVVDVRYSLAAYGLSGDRYFQRTEIALRLPDGTLVRPQNNRVRLLRFAVPGNLKKADLVIGGRGFFTDGTGTAYTADVSTATVRITWP